MEHARRHGGLRVAMGQIRHETMGVCCRYGQELRHEIIGACCRHGARAPTWAKVNAEVR